MLWLIQLLHGISQGSLRYAELSWVLEAFLQGLSWWLSSKNPLANGGDKG